METQNNFKRLLEQTLNEGKKVWYRQDNIGKAKYTINFYDGKSTHKDGSPFYSMKIFKNKPSMESFIKELTGKGYKER